jgi:hypothetical protein
MMEYFLPAVILTSLIAYIITHLPGLVCISVAAMAFEGYLTHLEAKEFKLDTAQLDRIKQLEAKVEGLLLSKGF